MNVAVIGKGTTSILTTLVLLQNGHNVTVFYDPLTPHIDVGESTTPHVQLLIYDVLGLSINDMVNHEIFSYKMGINFVNWGCGKTFHHGFSVGNLAHHFETKSFNNFIHNYLEKNELVTYVPKKVTGIDASTSSAVVHLGDNHSGMLFDFVINCCGWENDDNYINPIFNSVNSAQLFAEDLTSDHDSVNTLHLATEDGWQFGLPFPKKGKLKCGYLYNNQLINDEEIEKKLIDSGKTVRGKFSWTPRYAKEMITHPRVALNGNRLFFLEPLQALSLYYTIEYASLICEYLNEFTLKKLDEVNHQYNLMMWQYQLSLSFHYQYGSIYETDFWKKTTNNAKDFLRYSFNGNYDILEMNLKRDMQSGGRMNYSGIGCFRYNDVMQIHFGMNGEENNIKNIDQYLQNE